MILFSEMNYTFKNLTKLSSDNDRFPTVTSLSSADPTNLSFSEVLCVVLHLQYPINDMLAR